MKNEYYFTGIKAANEAVEALKKAGINAVVDINDHYTGIDNPGRNTPTTASSSNSLSSYVLNNDDHMNPGLGPMAAASPMVSGMGGFEEISDINYRVIVNNAGDLNEEIVKQIVQKAGGDVNDPNFRMPKGLENISMDELISTMINKMNRSEE